MPPLEEYVAFRTIGDWTTDDLILLTTSVASIYEARLSVKIRDRLLKRQLQESLKNWEKYLHHPLYDEWFMVWKKLLKTGRLFQQPFWALTTPFGIPLIHESQITATQIYNSLNFYAEEQEKCRIYTAIIASPGGFSFTGIAEIIKEIRELIKDLRYRNKQENIKGKLEIIEKYLNIQKNYIDTETGLPILPLIVSEEKLIEVVDKGIKGIDELEHRGKLKDVLENLTSLPKGIKK